MKTYSILFLCTANSARSQMAESIANQLGAKRLRAYSAGSHPAGRVHPMAVELLQNIGFPTQHLVSKSWDSFTTADAPEMDFIVTLCDRAAGEPCPTWPGHPITAHWNIPDPALATGSDEEKHQAFKLALQILQQRISLLLALRIDALDRLALETKLAQIGQPSLDKSA